MTLFLNKVVSSIIQIILFALIPFIWWLISGREQEKFTQWIGIKKVEGNKNKVSIIVIAISLVFMQFLFMQFLTQRFQKNCFLEVSF